MMRKFLFMAIALIGLISCNKSAPEIQWIESEEVSIQAAYPTILVQFANPQYDSATKKFKLDVEFRADRDSLRIFGMNTRFFFDATKFVKGSATTVDFVDFAPGYGKFSPNPPYYGTGNAGVSWFKLPTAPVTYVNGAIALNSTTAPPVYISTTTWTKLFSITVTAAQPLSGEQCPVFIWDKKLDPAKGAYVGPGSSGVVVTILQNITGGEFYTAPTVVRASQFNWMPIKDTAPFGQPNPTDCVITP